MYIGGLMLLIGTGLYIGSAAILLLALMLFCLVHLFVLFYEEPALTRQFGRSHEEYLRSVRRWTPRFAGRMKARGVPKSTVIRLPATRI